MGEVRMKTKIVIISILLIINTLFAQDLIVPWFKVSGTLTTGSLTTSAITNTGTSTVGTSSNYISMTPTTTTGMLTINANTAGDWSGIKFSGTGFNNSFDKYIEIGTHDFWSPTQFGATSIVCRNGNFTINSTVVDAEDYSFTLNSDGDSDAGVTVTHAYVESFTAAADPANTYLDYTATANKFRWGGATDYVSMEPAQTSGGINIVGATAGNLTAINISGAGYNNASDYLIYFSANNYWNAAGQAVVGTNLFAANGSVTINSAAADGENAYDLIINADMDAGTALTADEFRISATPASNPTAGVWSFTSTQSAGYLFDRTITTRDTVSAREAAGSVYTYFIPGGSLVTSSSREQKENIIERTMSNTDVLLDKIKIYQYNFKEDSLKSQHISMMADDWYEISAGFGGNTKEINYEHVMSFMLLSLKNQNAEIKELKKQLKDMKSQVTIVR